MWRLSLAIGFIFPIAAQNPTFAWKSVNVQGMGYVTGMVVNPLPPNDIYIRTDVGGAYRYDRAAARWLPLMDRFGTADSAFGVESIAVSPNDPNTVYAAVASNQVFTATGGGYYNETTWGGVLVSHSRGVWWADTGMPVGVYMGPNDDYRGTTGERLAVDPVRPGVVYFASQQNGLWRLNANGWAQAGAATLPNTSVSPGMTFILASSQALYAGVYGSGVWSSADGGDTWTSLGGPSNPVRAALSNDGTLVVSYGGDEGATTGSVGRYRNGAWSDITPLGIYAAYSGVTFDAAACCYRERQRPASLLPSPDGSQLLRPAGGLGECGSGDRSSRTHAAVPDQWLWRAGHGRLYGRGASVVLEVAEPGRTGSAEHQGSASGGWCGLVQRRGRHDRIPARLA